MRYIVLSVIFAVALLPGISEAEGYTPVKPYSTQGGLPGSHRMAGYGASHKYGVYTRNGRFPKPFTASPVKPHP
jgi:hypothetical protein